MIDVRYSSFVVRTMNMEHSECDYVSNYELRTGGYHGGEKKKT